MPLSSPPLLATALTVVETIISIFVIYLVFSALRGKKFRTMPAAIVIAINIISLLIFQINRTKLVTSLSPMTFLGSVHGLIGVASIAAFIILIKLAHNYNKADMNYMQSHRRLSYFVLLLWVVSLIMGELVYVVLYVI